MQLSQNQDKTKEGIYFEGQVVKNHFKVPFCVINKNSEKRSFRKENFD